MLFFQKELMFLWGEVDSYKILHNLLTQIHTNWSNNTSWYLISSYFSVSFYMSFCKPHCSLFLKRIKYVDQIITIIIISFFSKTLYSPYLNP